MSSTNFYEVLGIDADVSPEDIRRAYRKKALRTHPDRLPQGATDADREAANEQFRKVNNAYEILIDPDKRKVYDLYGVWPPPEAFPEQPKQRRGEYSGYPSHHPYPPTGPQFDPFFTDPFARHRPPPGFAFTNPFELFDSIFSDMTHDFHRTHDPVITPHLFNPYARRHGPFHHHHPMSPFSGFSPLIVTPHLFSSFLSHDGDNYGSGPSMPGNSNHYSYSSTTRAQYGPDDNGQRPRWVSESTVMRTVNGVTQTVHTRKDSLGNQHVTKIYPDGREKYTVNGIEQPQLSGRMQDLSLSEQQHSNNHDHHTEPPIIPSDPQEEGTSRKRWWGRR